jgi:hypothetical protein
MKPKTKKQYANQLLRAMVGNDLALLWWNRYNRAFKCTPSSQWKKDPDVVITYLEQCAYGGW